jgi:hypothetical protein
VTATFIFLMIGLKVPIIMLLYLVWWAIKQSPENAGDNGGGAPVDVPPDRHPRPRPPRLPRRGPHHGAPAPVPPPRVRSVTARGREMADSNS